MSMMVVTDVTGAASGTSAAIQPIGQTSSDDTTITPFQTVLEKTVSETASQKAKKSVSNTSTEHVKKAKSACEGAGGGGGESTTKLANIFKRASEKYDISYDFLVAVAKAESDFNYKCVSSAGAKGIMQLMPDEVKEFGVTDVFDPEQNIMAAAKLLAAHLKKFNGDFTLAAAAYNAGSGAVQKYGGVPPYSETQNYVKKIAKYMKEGVTVPDKEAHSTVDYSAYESVDTGSVSSGTVHETEVFDEGKQASDSDWDKVRITVNDGGQEVTMTYGAYLKYKELGTLGVG